MRNVLGIVLLLAVGFAAVTLTALEGNEVVVLRTFDTTGRARETRVWVAEQDGALWVEAATPERDFYRDLAAHSEIEVVRHGSTIRVSAHPEPGPEGHARIRSLLNEKYGWADDWVGLLQDTSRSIAVRLIPIANEQRQVPAT